MILTMIKDPLIRSREASKVRINSGGGTPPILTLIRNP